jgi:histidyl-tRNA synthetase
VKESKPGATPAKGMRDLLPRQVETRDWASARIFDVYASYGFTRIETPAVENLKVLVGAQGGENEKLIFKIMKRGEKLSAAEPAEAADLGLRFDLTVPLARYYAHLHANLPQPFRAIQIGPVWRAEQPQRGRYRQFTQCDIDILGLGSHLAEVELIRATVDALAAVTLKSLVVRINDRRLLVALVKGAGFTDTDAGPVLIALDKMDKVGAEGVRGELLTHGLSAPVVDRFLGSIEALDRQVSNGSGEIETLALPIEPGVVESLATIIRAVQSEREPWAQSGTHVDIRFDPTLVRGMGYYTGPIFEIAHTGYPSSIAGGGRYDTMIGRFLGRPVPACGFSIGFERLVEILEEGALAGSFRAERPKLALLVDERLDDLGPLLAFARAQRASGGIVVLEPKSVKNLGKQLYQLARDGFRDGRVYQQDGTFEDLGARLREKISSSPDGA